MRRALPNKQTAGGAASWRWNSRAGSQKRSGGAGARAGCEGVSRPDEGVPSLLSRVGLGSSPRGVNEKFSETDVPVNVENQLCRFQARPCMRRRVSLNLSQFPREFPNVWLHHFSGREHVLPAQRRCALQFATGGLVSQRWCNPCNKFRGLKQHKFLLSQYGSQKSKVKMSSGLLPPEGLRRKCVALPFPALRGCLCSLAPGPFLPHLSLLLLPFALSITFTW